MKKYYIYHVRVPEEDNRRVNAFVEDPEEFAADPDFDPRTMEFSGVFVEANNEIEAATIYKHPLEQDVMVSCDEPKPTKVQRDKFEYYTRLLKGTIGDIQKQINLTELALRAMQIRILAARMSMQAVKSSSILAKISEELCELSTVASVEDIYKHVLDAYIEQLQKIGYRPSDEDDGNTTST
jgi:hypothetical protein